MVSRTGDSAISVASVRKSYGTHEALRGVDLEIAAGEILVLLGPNGAGKTTLVSIIAGLRRPDSGRVLVLGVDVGLHPVDARSHIGLAAQDTAIYPTITVRDNLRLFGRIGGIWGAELESRIDELTEVLGLGEFVDRKARFLSGGEKRRLHTALALVHRPAVLLLDEPTTGADPMTRANMLGHVAKLAGEGVTVIYTTHYLAEVDALGSAVSVAILDRGQIIAAGPVSTLLEEHAAPVAVLTFDTAVTDAALESIADGLPAGVQITRVDDRALRVASHHPVPDAMAALAAAGRDSSDLHAIEIVGDDLESVFLSLTGKRYGDA
jgi:ABC-2 type transport system ATP-binding protein